MAKTSPRRVRILRDITYHPPGTLAWYRVFRAGWEGPVTEQQYTFLLAEKAGESASAPRAPASGSDGDAP